LWKQIEPLFMWLKLIPFNQIAYKISD
jgi:hypothetical protein